MSDDSVKVHLRYTTAGEEQGGEHFWANDLLDQPDGTYTAHVGNVLFSDILGYGDTIRLRMDNQHVIEVLHRTGIDTQVVYPHEHIPGQDPVRDAAWAQLLSLLAAACREADLPCEGGFGPLLIHGDPDVVDALVDQVVDSPQGQPMADALAPSDGSAAIRTGTWYDASMTVGDHGPEMDGWQLIGQPRPEPEEPPLDPDFAWDPADDAACVRYAADHPIDGIPVDAWFAATANLAATSGAHQQMAKNGEGVRVLYVVANMNLIHEGRPRLPVDLDEYLPTQDEA